MKTRLTALIAFVTLFVLNSGVSALACPFCGGDTTGSKMGQAAGWGIFAMVIIMFTMLGTLIGFGFYLNYRAKHPLPDYQELLKEDEVHPESDTTS
ncbi:MAG: hypothetical protein LV481_01170 [Methylacidiphilales bacterium]|nr:hypothetical protein [Candidatus Methylacidiphilales bacterium]